MSEKPLLEQVCEWFAATGFPLEMQVGKALRDLNFNVQQSAYYDDAGTFRELDVVATQLYDTPQAMVNFVLFIECKTSRTKPWVVFAGDPLRSPDEARDILRWGPGNSRGKLLRRL